MVYGTLVEAGIQVGGGEEEIQLGGGDGGEEDGATAGEGVNCEGEGLI